MKKGFAFIIVGVCAFSLIFSESGFASTRPELPAAATTATPQAPQDLTKQLDDYFTKLTKDLDFSGSVLIARDGKVLLSKGYGMADLEHDAPNTPQTKFRLGSITKQFTAMAILILQAQGKLNVQVRICKYLDKCPKAWEDITIHHLLTHTSGIRSFTDLPDYRQIKRQPHLPREIVDLFKDLPLEFKPGERWSYSNSGYVVLGEIIAKVAEMPYAVFLNRSIFDPLQMSGSGYDLDTKVIKNRAIGYVSDNVKADYIDMTIPYSAGALYSTVEDLYKWDQALYTEKLIPKKLLDEMFKPQMKVPEFGRDVSYGYGWAVDKQLGHRMIEHGGGIEGFRTDIMRFPDEKVTVIVLSNREAHDAYNTALTAAKIVFGEK